jgi:glycosyltransferase involved in cell wall biosynthesis
VSVLIPTYNCAKFVGEAIDSITAQTVQVKEIIVIDDGSTDQTFELLKDDPRIRYVRTENRGVAAARNTALSLASAELVAFLDADDRWLPDMIATQLEFMRSSPEIVCSFTNFVRFEEGSDRRFPDQFTYYPELDRMPKTVGPLAGSFLIDGDAFDAFVSMGDIPAFTQVMLFRRSELANIKFDSSVRVCDDMHFVLQAVMGRRIGYITKVLAQVRRHGHNASRDVSEMPVYKLFALKKLANHVPARSQRIYNDRLVKAHIDAASAVCRKGRLAEGARYAYEGFAVRGSLLRKLKGAARICISSMEWMISRFR